MNIQLSFDAVDPRRLADFWAYALHYRRDDPPDGFASWQDYLAAEGIPEDEWNSGDAIVPIGEEGPRIYFQRVPEEKTAKNRLHLDIVAAPGLRGEKHMAVLEARADELESRGAIRIKRFEPNESGQGWIVMEDPEGNEFCVI
ncbi:VOC family protein [Flaviflexus equikiangi]|uniref:VOC family protein n=1 Tax=Flaviflexus equikiangi TaxID=2758573 RepID=A0ABS2TD54_9ACTO|nr:VOC family protein [Flaviflexus equikiangi]MBM9432567.1 VOC family protein [Flaviflexus equikiangi]